MQVSRTDRAMARVPDHRSIAKCVISKAYGKKPDSLSLPHCPSQPSLLTYIFKHGTSFAVCLFPVENCIVISSLKFYSSQLFIKSSTISGKQCNFDRVKEFCISQGSVLTYFRCGGQMYNQ